MSHIHDMRRPPLSTRVRLAIWSLASIGLVLLLDQLGVVDISSWTR